MITLEELKRDKEALEEKFRLYEEQQKEKDFYELEYPKVGDTVWVIRDYGLVNEVVYNSEFEDEFKQGNVVYTEEEAELEEKRRKLMTRFNQFRDKCNGDWKPDFKKTGEKYCISNEENLNLQIGWRIYNNNYPKFGYFKNKEDCQRAIELFGDEIKELF